MSDRGTIAGRQELELRLAELESQFRSEALRRGFDPNQVDNMALPASLANLFADCAAIRSELKETATQPTPGDT